jgi:GMP synthase (glutamine-hydrolysing)
MKNTQYDKIVIIDYGSQYTQLIAKAIRKHHLFSEIIPYHKFTNTLPLKYIKGIILSGSPKSVVNQKYPDFHYEHFKDTKIPILGICYGAQLLAKHNNEHIDKTGKCEYGSHKIIISKDQDLLGITEDLHVWMSHNDTITSHKNIDILAKTENDVIAAYKVKDREIYGIQFHPEVSHTEYGEVMIQNFLNKCDIREKYTIANYKDTTIMDLKNKLGNDKVVIAISGGVDSAVAAILLHKAIGENLYCIFVDNGLLRKNESTQVISMLIALKIQFRKVDASKEFYTNLENITDPEEKRKIIGKTFIDVFSQYISTFPKKIKWLAQGTIYPDVIESVPGFGLIKSHHNVGGLPKNLQFELVEPLRMLFKDEVRELGRELGLPDMFIKRHPFPGPGLSIRIIGSISREKIKILQEADAIFINEIKKRDLYDKIWQAGAILLPIRSVGVMGDCRTYEFTIVLRAVCSVNGMTAKPYWFDGETLEYISTKIVNEVQGVNRVVYDTTSKPPGTIEWE